MLTIRNDWSDGKVQLNQIWVLFRKPLVANGDGH